MIGCQTSCDVAKLRSYMHVLNWDLRGAQRNSPPSADECENSFLASNSAQTSFCAVKVNNKQNTFLSRGRPWWALVVWDLGSGPFCIHSGAFLESCHSPSLSSLIFYDSYLNEGIKMPMPPSQKTPQKTGKNERNTHFTPLLLVILTQKYEPEYRSSIFRS